MHSPDLTLASNQHHCREKAIRLYFATCTYQVETLSCIYGIFLLLFIFALEMQKHISSYYYFFQALIELRVISRIYVDLAISFYGCVESLAANLSKRDMP